MISESQPPRLGAGFLVDLARSRATLTEQTKESEREEVVGTHVHTSNTTKTAPVSKRLN